MASVILADSTFALGASMTSIWLVTARLSFIPEENTLLLLMPHALARRPRKRLVSQLFKETLATVNLPLGSRAGIHAISSTRKSSTLILRRPPIPSPSEDHPVNPNCSSIELNDKPPPPSQFEFRQILRDV